MIILIYLLILITICTLVLSQDFKYYKSTYKILLEGNFKIDYSFPEQLKLSNGFIWFRYDNTFKLSKDHYLFNAIFTYFSPYSLYWLIKYKKLMKEKFAKI